MCACFLSFFRSIFKIEKVNINVGEEGEQVSKDHLREMQRREEGMKNNDTERHKCLHSLNEQ